MFELTVENENGELLQLTQSEKYDVIEIEGLCPPAAQINMTELAGADGASFNSARLETRNLVITINIKPPVEKNRIDLYKYFRVKHAVKIHYSNGSRSVYIDGYVETFENNFFSMTQQPQISIICPDPYWKSEAGEHVEFSEVTSLFEFPFSISAAGTAFSSIDHVASMSIDAGEVATGAVITFHASAGGVKNPAVYDLTTGEFFGVTATMQEGDTITIDTRIGHKKVTLTRSGTTTSLLSSRTSGSKWVQLAPGENQLSYDAEEGQSDLEVTVSLTPLYEGM